MSCAWEVVRRLRLQQKCKKYVTKRVDKRSDSHWCYANNEGQSKSPHKTTSNRSFREEYQKKVGNTKEERAKRDILPDIAHNFASIKKVNNEVQALENKKAIGDIQAIDGKLTFDGKQLVDTITKNELSNQQHDTNDKN